MAVGSLAVLGSINMDVVLRAGHLPAPGETVIATGVTRQPGGKGANQAIAAARAGASVAMIGAVGDDADGAACLAALRDAGVDHRGVVALAGVPTGVAHIVVDDRGENQIVVAGGANGSVPGGSGVAADILLAQLEVPTAAIAAFFRSRRAGVWAILNAAPVRADAREAIAAADLVVVNEVELAALARAAPPESPDAVIAMAGAARDRADLHIVVTLGAAGSVLVGPDGATAYPAVPVDVVDSTGAGDCFCGYLAAGLAAGRGLDESIRLAHRAAALAVGRPGAAPAMPFLREVI